MLYSWGWRPPTQVRVESPRESARREVPQARLATERLGRPVRPVAATLARTASAQGKHPLAAERVVEHRRAVAALPRIADVRPRDAVRRRVEAVVRHAAGHGHHHPPVRVRVFRLVVGKHAPAVEQRIGQAPAVKQRIGQHAVRTLHDSQIFPFPRDTVLRLGVAQVFHPSGLVPEAEHLLHGIPPQTAARRPRHGCETIRTLRIDLSLKIRLRPHHRRVERLRRMVVDAHDTLRGIDEEVIHEQLPPDVDVNRRRGDVARATQRHNGNYPLKSFHILLHYPITLSR